MLLRVVCNFLLAVRLLGTGFVRADEVLWTAVPLTTEGVFTKGIEGPNSDAVGNVYAVNYAHRGTIGRVLPDGTCELFVELPLGETNRTGKPTQSVGNGIVFDSSERMYVADYVNHNVLRIDLPSAQIEVFAHDDRFHQPNDLAIGPDDILWCSDPDWSAGAGQLFRVDNAGKVSRVAEKLGTTNGIEVSPDGKTLYVNESTQRGVWRFPIQADGTLGERALLKQFDEFGFDGMRCDADGNLFVTRHGKGTVVVLSPQGDVLREIEVLGKQPSNLCFGGADGRTVFVTEVEHQRLVTFRADQPGANWARRHARTP